MAAAAESSKEQQSGTSQQTAAAGMMGQMGAMNPAAYQQYMMMMAQYQQQHQAMMQGAMSDPALAQQMQQQAMNPMLMMQMARLQQMQMMAQAGMGMLPQGAGLPGTGLTPAQAQATPQFQNLSDKDFTVSSLVKPAPAPVPPVKVDENAAGAHLKQSPVRHPTADDLFDDEHEAANSIFDVINTQEQHYYATLFAMQQETPDRQGIQLRPTADFLKKSNLNKNNLKAIWDEIVKKGSPHITKEQFYSLLRLVALKQQHPDKPFTAQDAKVKHAKHKLPEFQGVPLPPEEEDRKLAASFHANKQ